MLEQSSAERIKRAVKRALEPLNSPNLSWQEYHRRLQATPDLVLHEIVESGVLFRLPEQADWPLIIEAFQKRPYALTVRTQMTVGGQTLGFDQQMDDRMLYGRVPMDRDLARHMGKHAIRATLEAVAEPYYEQAALQFASAIEAHRAGTTEIGPVHESAVGEVETPEHSSSHHPRDPEMDEGYTFTPVPGTIREGDWVRLTMPRWTKRKWWQLWKPKWTEHPATTEIYRSTALDRIKDQSHEL
jgi:hypothetical protein